MRRKIMILMTMSLSLSIILTALTSRTVHAGSALWSPLIHTQSTITQSYIQAGGKGGLGEPVGSPTPWAQGCLQDYSGGRAKSAAIIVEQCVADTSAPTTINPTALSPSRIVRGEFWEYAKVHTSSEIGSPLSNDQVLSTGRWQTFSGGTWGLTELYQATTSDKVYAVHDQMHDEYQSMGGPSGKLGWPISEQYEWSGELRQDFQYGSLVWRTETGTRSLVSWKSGQVLMSPTSDPSSYLIREFGSYKVATPQLNRCYGGKVAAKTISADELSLTQKVYPVQGSAPDCVTPEEQAAINWAVSQLHSTWSNHTRTYWSGRCETFVELAFGTRSRAISAQENYLWRLARNQIHTDQAAPAGTLVFYGGSSDGHVGISLGDGTVISTQGYIGDRLPVWQHRTAGLSNPYLGWAYVDNSWPR